MVPIVHLRFRSRFPRCDFALPNFDADRSSLSAPHDVSPNVMRYGGNLSSKVRAASISAVAKPSVRRHGGKCMEILEAMDVTHDEVVMNGVSGCRRSWRRTCH